MTKEGYKKMIIEVVDTGPIKNVDLALRVMANLGPVKFEVEVHELAIAELLQEKEIIELEYIILSMDYRVKSLYFPKGTDFNFFGNSNEIKEE